MAGIMEFAPQAGHKVAGGFLGTGTAQHRDEPGPLDLDLMPEVRPRSKRRVGGGQSLLLLHRPSLARAALWQVGTVGRPWVGPRRPGSLAERSEVREAVGLG